jgi:hypothetical protein
MFTATFKHKGWTLMVDSKLNQVHVTKDQEFRVYDMPHQVCMVGQNVNHPEYVRIDFENTDEYLTFKFEENNFLVGDMWLEEEPGEYNGDEHLREFACHVFAEDS